MKPLRVLYCTDTYPPQVNGVSVVASLSVDGLSFRGWQCGVVSPRYPTNWHDPFRRADVAYSRTYLTTLPSVPLPGYPDIRLSLPRRSQVEEAIRAVRPHIVHAQTEFVIGRMGAQAALRAGIPLVTSYHTDFGRYAAAYGVPAIEGLVSRSLARFHRAAARTYTPGGPAAEDLRRMGVANVEVWGRGVDLEIFSPDRRTDSVRSTLGLDGAFVFLHVGRLAAEKGVERILAAFALARERLAPRSVRLVIAGSGPRKDSLQAAAPPDTHFLGHLDRSTALPALYASADAFLFASHTETLGLVVLEAMASGLPVVAAPMGGVADHLRHDVNGLAYAGGDVPAFADALVRVVQDDLLHRRLSGGARRTALGLSWENEMDRLDASYREVIAGSPAGGAAVPRLYSA